MAAQVDQQPQSATLDAFHQRYAHLFGRREIQRLARYYLQGLIDEENNRAVDTDAGEERIAHPRAIQRMLSEARWDADQITAAVQRDIARRLNHANGVFILGEIGFPKRGTGLVGIERQPVGSHETLSHQQVGIFLAYASPHGQALIDFRLYLPRRWCTDHALRASAHIPDAVRYGSRRTLGISLLARAADLGCLQGRWVVSDLPWTSAPEFRDKLNDMGWWYACSVAPHAPVFGPRRRSPASGQTEKPDPSEPVLETEGWHQVLLPRPHGRLVPYRLIARRVLDNRDSQPGRECWLIIRRDNERANPRYFLSNAPAGTSSQNFALVTQWLDPEKHPFAAANVFAGLSRYTVRSWAGWHHHMALALMAAAFLLEASGGTRVAQGELVR